MAAQLEQAVVRLLASDALAARQSSYSPYSDYAVGAALLCEGGRVFTGCNVENAAYSPAICAERAALAKAVSEGYRKFKAIAIAGGPSEVDPIDYCYPCGVCRQTLTEFDDGDLTVILVKTPDDVQLTTLRELFPHSFSGADLQK